MRNPFAVAPVHEKVRIGQREMFRGVVINKNDAGIGLGKPSNIGGIGFVFNVGCIDVDIIRNSHQENPNPVFFSEQPGSWASPQA